MIMTKKRVGGAGHNSQTKESSVVAELGLKRVRVKISGLPPGIIFQGKGIMEAGADSGGKQVKPRSPDEEARLRAHWMEVDGKQQLCIPWVMLYQSICTAGNSFKFKGQKKMGGVIAATVSCEQDNIPLGTSRFETYEEWVKIPPKTGAMVKIGRPRLKTWEVEFILVVDDEMYSAEKLREVIVLAGKLVGIGAWRPERRGPYGRFELLEFEVL